MNKSVRYASAVEKVLNIIWLASFVYFVAVCCVGDSILIEAVVVAAVTVANLYYSAKIHEEIKSMKYRKIREAKRQQLEAWKIS